MEIIIHFQLLLVFFFSSLKLALGKKKKREREIKLMRSQIKAMYMFSLKRHLLLQGILSQGGH